MNYNIFESSLKKLTLLNRGKVRDIYIIDNENLLIITTDRLSAFNMIMNELVPGKGRILNKMSNFWFKRFSHIIPNHLKDIPPENFVSLNEKWQVYERASIVKKMNPIPIEAIVRGYLTGSIWNDYQNNISFNYDNIKDGMIHGEKLCNPIFTPSMKSKNDKNITYKDMIHMIGKKLSKKIYDVSLNLYINAHDYALKNGIIIADTKFEFGLDMYDNLYLIDEVLTPDSSRFWLADKYKINKNIYSLDKQIIRNWLEKSGWKKVYPPLNIPNYIIKKTIKKYKKVFEYLVK